VIQRNARLGFHAPARSAQDLRLSAEGYSLWASYLRKLGLTEEQILYSLGTPQPMMRFVTEADAKAMGIYPQEVPLQTWRNCSFKYCLIVP
jgi:hypothetical protein